MPLVARSATDQTYRTQVEGLRRSKGWTQEELARMAGLSKTMVFRAERGQGIGPAAARRIATACDASLEDLFADRDVAWTPPEHLLVQRLPPVHGPSAWAFAYPRITAAVRRKAEAIADDYEQGVGEDETIASYRKLLDRYPEFLQVYSDLGVVLEKYFQGRQAAQIWRTAAELACRALPPEFHAQRGTLAWGEWGNFPVFDIYRHLASYYADNHAARARTYCKQLLRWCPIVPRVRDLLVQVDADMKRWAEIIRVAQEDSRFSPDPAVLYAVPLAWLHLGKKERAREAMHSAASQYPKYAHVLLDGRDIPNSLDDPADWDAWNTYVDSLSEALSSFWCVWHGHWQETPRALDMLQACVSLSEENPR